MNTQELFQTSHITHLRELKAENAQLRAELARAQEERDMLRSHFALALAAARDAEGFSAGGTFFIVDGWNALLGADGILHGNGAWRGRPAAELEAYLMECARGVLAMRPADFLWIVFDGARADGRAEAPRLRVTWTGGAGLHRADRFVCDYLRMRRLTGAAGRVTVVTDDKDFRREAIALGAAVVPARTFFASVWSNEKK